MSLKLRVSLLVSGVGLSLNPPRMRLKRAFMAAQSPRRVRLRGSCRRGESCAKRVRGRLHEAKARRRRVELITQLGKKATNYYRNTENPSKLRHLLCYIMSPINLLGDGRCGLDVTIPKKNMTQSPALHDNDHDNIPLIHGDSV